MQAINSRKQRSKSTTTRHKSAMQYTAWKRYVGHPMEAKARNDTKIARRRRQGDVEGGRSTLENKATFYTTTGFCDKARSQTESPYPWRVHPDNTERLSTARRFQYIILQYPSRLFFLLLTFSLCCMFCFLSIHTILNQQVVVSDQE